jgi:ParB family chromosome partitioning protein
MTTSSTLTKTDTDPQPAAAEPAATEAAPELLMLDPKTLLVDGNVRGKVTLDEDFLTSLREFGVLEPIVAVRTDDGQHRVRFGQRRTLGAIKAGLTRVPVSVTGEDSSTDAAQIRRIVTQVHENEQRAGLAEADLAGAVEQLAAFGLPADAIAAQLLAEPAQVQKALTVAGSKLASKSLARWDFLTIDQAAKLTDFEGQAATVKALVAAAKTSPGEFNHVYQRAVDDRAAKELRAKLTKQLAVEKTPVVARPGYDERRIKRLTVLAADKGGSKITPASHRACPGHAAFLGPKETWGGGDLSIVYVCTDPSKYGHRSTDSTARVPAAAMTPEELHLAREARRSVREHNADWRSARTVRLNWLKEFLSRKTPPKGSSVFVATELAHGSHVLRQAMDMEYTGGATLRELLAVKTSTEIVAACERATEARAQVLALGFVLAAVEASLANPGWQRPEALTGRYLAFLAANGYTLSSVEKLCLPKPKPTTGGRRTSKAATVTQLPAASTAGTPEPAGDQAEQPAEEPAGEPEPAA